MMGSYVPLFFSLFSLSYCHGIKGILPRDTLSHFCVVTSWGSFNTTLSQYSALLGQPAPTPGVAGGAGSNGTYVVNGVPQKLIGTTLIAFMQLNNSTRMEFLAGDEGPSWWRDVYAAKGFEIHHQGYALPKGVAVWPVVEAAASAGIGPPVQWGRWGDINRPGSGCYVYVDSQKTLGVTVEVLGGSEGECDGLPAPPA
jgi:hypothetical protein